MAATSNSISNSVSNLKSVNFSQLTQAEILQIEEKGRQTPDLIISSPSTNKGKVYFRKFSTNLYQKHDWLTGCREKKLTVLFSVLALWGRHSLDARQS